MLKRTEQELIDLIEEEHNQIIRLEKIVEQKRSKINQLEFQLRELLIS